MEQAFQAMYRCEGLFTKLSKAQHKGELPSKVSIIELIEKAKFIKLINEDEAEAMLAANELRLQAINVDNFAPGELEGRTVKNSKAA